MNAFSHSAGGVVLNRQGDVLVIQQRDGTWSLPKGGIKKGEDPRDAAAREIMEEGGLTDLTMICILKSYSRFPITNTGSEDTGRLKRITMYLFHTKQTDLRPMDTRITKAVWTPKEEVAGMLSNPKDQEFFRSVLAELDHQIVMVSGDEP